LRTTLQRRLKTLFIRFRGHFDHSWSLFALRIGVFLKNQCYDHTFCII
jgi:hypothetical protein